MQWYPPKSQHSCGKMGVRDNNETEARGPAAVAKAGGTRHQQGGRQEPPPRTSTHDCGVCMPLTHTDTAMDTDTRTK